MKLPTDLVQKMQGDYVALKYKDGVFTFANIDEETLSTFIKSFFEWAENKDIVDENGKLDIGFIKKW